MNITSEKLNQALQIQSQIEEMQKKLQAVLNGEEIVEVVPRKRRLSAKARANIALGQKLRREREAAKTNKVEQAVS